MYKPPVPTTAKDGKVPFKTKYLEGILRAPKSPLLDREYEPKVVSLLNGQDMVVRMADEDDADLILEACKKMMDQNLKTDFFDLVAARTYAEILGWVRKRVKDEWVQIGVTEEGELAGIVNARLWDESRAISFHTIVTKRRVGAGTPLYFAKMEYAFDNLEVDQWEPTFESYYGFRMGCIRGAAQGLPWPENQHELGGSRTFYNTKEQWESYLKPSFEKILGSRPVPDELLEAAENPELPDIASQFE